ncbi:MAG: peptide-methionine (R)-S-oxide reductase [Bacteroidetes bacterium]|nr:MAG: peptide-methionine (R)-S-oxide reductase [Bacteroidota bacterium]
MSKFNIDKTENQWRSELSEEQYKVLRNKGTELPHTGKYNLHFENGAYNCAACNMQLFESDSKFDAHCGWPSFDDAIKGTVDRILDKSQGMLQTEIVCSNCGSHLGHVFNDGPTETGERFCVNSVSIDFNKNE